MSDFPPAPWRLRGNAWLSLWRVPVRVLPPPVPGIAYRSIGSCAWLATLWADYQEGGTLAYHELAVAVLVRGRGLLAPACSVSPIWVDSERSLEGGRALWHIPKALGSFTHTVGDGGVLYAALNVDDARIASLHFTPTRALPARPALSGFAIQPGPGGPVRTRCAGRGKPILGQANWDFAVPGPLDFLHGRQPMLSLQLADLRASFGV